jgi:adenine deaminase
MIVVDSLENLEVLKTIVRGETVAEAGKSGIPHRAAVPVNVFRATARKPEDFRVLKRSDAIRVIGVIEDQVVTYAHVEIPALAGDAVVCDTDRDILKIAVVNRYADRPPAVAFVRGFNLKKGALASSIAHDSHNIVAVGTSDEMLCDAVNLVIEKKGGISLVSEDMKMVLPLPVAGLMSNEDDCGVAERYSRLTLLARDLGTTLKAPFMTLSFMALVVIPKLKVSDRGLFDGEKFAFTEVFL